MSAEGEMCLFSPCHASGALQTFKTVAVQKIVATSKMKHDEPYKSLSESYILAHKSCYCSYTSRSRKNKQGKRTSTLTDTLFQLCPLPELVCATDGAPSPACQEGPIGRCTRLSALGWGHRSASRSVRRADIYQAREGFWRYKGHFNESRASGCVGE